LVAKERSEVKRAAYLEKVAAIDSAKLVFIDESGFSLDLHRRYGWTIGGGRCMEAVPVNTGMNRSVVGAYSLPTAENPTGMWALWQKLGAWNAYLFELYISEGVLPLLPEGSVLVMDNASIHKGESLAKMVAEAGCSILYLAPYSPDFSPIEPVWSWLKHHVRKAKPADDTQREQAIWEAQMALPPSAAKGWFTHCGLC
jgi:hypothetical protein